MSNEIATAHIMKTLEQLTHHYRFGRVELTSQHEETQARVGDDGRVTLQFNERVAKHLSQRFGQVYKERQKQRSKSKQARIGFQAPAEKHHHKDYAAVLGPFSGVPRLNIAIQIVGSRGDVQPFIAIGKVLQAEPYRHRVRICTHPVFKGFVEENGLEFFSIGGDPTTLMAYMVKNPGLMPGMESLKAGDVRKRRADMAEILEGCWRGCIESGNGLPKEMPETKRPREEEVDAQFIADAIIANPPSYAHLHCAERLRIPLHMMFTMPWSPTQAFPHPLIKLERTSVDPSFQNYISYTMMELLAWQGLGDIINNFRSRTLRLDPISPLWGHMLLPRMKVPYTYLWSQALIPKPSDWGPHITIAGFSFLSLKDSYQPPEDLVEFLKAGPPPVYIGFGSIVVDNPTALTALIYSAVKKAGVRALVSKGWGGVGGQSPPDGVFLLGNCPHDWLFPQVSCVVHHGGAGTTAIGVALGIPTVVVPFFGDQPFWGAMIARAGAGPVPIAFKKMTADTLAQSIMTALGPEVLPKARILKESIEKEPPGAEEAARYFTEAVQMNEMRCHLCPERVAIWRLVGTHLRLSSFAASVLLNENVIKLHQIRLIHHRHWYIDEGAEDPVTAMVASVSGALTNTIIILSDYKRHMGNILSKKADKPAVLLEPDATTPSSTTVTDAGEPYYNAIAQVPSRIAIHRVQSYSSSYLEGAAERMASKSISKKRKTVDDNRPSFLRRRATFLVPKRADTASSSAAKKKEDEGRRKKGEEARLSTDSHKVYDAAVETEDLMERLLLMGFKTPVAVFYNLANGFHNAPSFLMGDETVRRRGNIHDIKSGLSIGGKGLVLGFYDGMSGLVTQPVLGARSGWKKGEIKGNRKGAVGGVVGAGKGVGKGIGGLVFKPIAGVLGVLGYGLKGVERQVEGRKWRDVEKVLYKQRIEQAIVEWGRASDEEKEKVVGRWRDFQGRRERRTSVGASASVAIRTRSADERGGERRESVLSRAAGWDRD